MIGALASERRGARRGASKNVPFVMKQKTTRHFREPRRAARFRTLRRPISAERTRVRRREKNAAPRPLIVIFDDTGARAGDSNAPMRRNTILSLFLGLLLVAGAAVPGTWRGNEPDLAAIGREAR